MSLRKWALAILALILAVPIMLFVCLAIALLVLFLLLISSSFGEDSASPALGMLLMIYIWTAIEIGAISGFILSIPAAYPIYKLLSQVMLYQVGPEN